MNNSMSFPSVPDAALIYQIVVDCGRDIIAPEAPALSLSDFMRPLLTSSASKGHAELLGQYIAASLLGNPNSPKAEVVKSCRIGWGNANTIQAQGGLKTYESNPNAHMYAVMSFLLHGSQSRDLDFTKGASRLSDGPLAVWVGEEVIFDFNEEGWKTSKPK